MVEENRVTVSVGVDTDVKFFILPHTTDNLHVSTTTQQTMCYQEGLYNMTNNQLINQSIIQIKSNQSSFQAR